MWLGDELFPPPAFPTPEAGRRGGKEGQCLTGEGAGSRGCGDGRGAPVEDCLSSPRRWAASRRRLPAGPAR